VTAIQLLKTELLSWLAAHIMRLLFSTLRIRIIDGTGVLPRCQAQPVIMIAWHNRILLMPYIYTKILNKNHGAVMTSASRDGALVAGILKRFGIASVRGSSSRHGTKALIKAIHLVRDKGMDFSIIPDGPRGPRYRMSPGVVVLAQRSNAPLLPVHMEFSRFWQLKSWDRFIIPKPFSTVQVSFCDFFEVPPDFSRDELESKRLSLEQLMRSALSDRELS